MKILLCTPYLETPDVVSSGMDNLTVKQYYRIPSN